MFRIQAVTCLQIDTESKNNGRTEVLSGYHNYFLLGAYYFRKLFPSEEHKPGKYFSPIVVQEVFSKNLKEFIEYIDTFYNDDTLLPQNETSLKKDKYTYIYNSLPKKKINIEWIQPDVEPGDIFCFDQRLPHRNTKNDSKIARVASFVSLYPKSYLLPNEEISIYDMFRGKTGKVRNNYANSLEREYFADVWKERTKFEKTTLVKRMLALE